jgi:superfamily II DNA or RNA helicase
MEVPVNVQMVTEGVDVPSIQTVFLTRPTGSEILMPCWRLVARG